MNVNEVIANRAVQISGKNPGSYEFISPLDDINLHQSTNNIFPTALKIAAIRLFRQLEKRVLELQETSNSISLCQLLLTHYLKV